MTTLAGVNPGYLGMAGMAGMGSMHAAQAYGMATPRMMQVGGSVAGYREELAMELV